MTKLLDKAELDKVKPGDLLKVVSYGKKGFGLEMVQSGKTMPVLLEMPKGLYRVMLARATLFDNSLNQEIMDLLKEVMKGWIEVAVSDEFEMVYNHDKKPKPKKDKAKK